MVYLLEKYVLVGEVTREDRQAGAADGARLGADRALDDFRHDDALQVEFGSFIDGGLHHAAAHPIGKAAIDDGRTEIDDRGGGDDRLRQCLGTILIQASIGSPKSTQSSAEYQSGSGSMPRSRSMFSSTKIEAISSNCFVSPFLPRTGSGPIAPAVPVRPEKIAELSTMPPPMKEPMKK